MALTLGLTFTDCDWIEPLWMMGISTFNIHQLD